MPQTPAAFSTLRKSLVRFLYDFGQDTSKNGYGEVLEYVELDAHAQVHELPEGNVIGLSGFSMEFDDHLIYVDTAIGLIMRGDKDLIRHGEVMDALLGHLRPTRTLPVYHPTTGNTIGWMAIENGVEVMPVGKADTRTVQMITLSLSTDQTLKI